MSKMLTSDWTRINAAADRFEPGWKHGPGTRMSATVSEKGWSRVSSK